MKLPINRYQIKRALPTITTALACAGVVGTGVWSAKAMYDYMQGVDTSTGAKIKAAAGPAGCALLTMVLMVLTRTMDAKAIAGLAAAEAAIAKQLSDTNRAIKDLYGEAGYHDISDKVAEYQDKDKGIDSRRANDVEYLDTTGRLVVIDDTDDAVLYYEQNLEIYILAKPLTIANAFKSLNRNYQIRGGLASYYEWLRFLGVKKYDIKRLGLDWTEWVGWHAQFMMEDGQFYIDEVISDAKEDENGVLVHTIGWAAPFMPICADPPAYIHDMCKTDEQDTEYLDDNDILNDIKAEIQDDAVA